MANRFWVGGTASWNGTATGKWATTSGGAAGAAEPLASDDVFFDAASGAAVVTVATSARPARSITFTGFTGTFAGSVGLNIGDGSGGALLVVAGMTWTHNGAITFVSTSNNGGAGWNITAAGKTFGAVTFNGAGGKWTLQDTFTTGGSNIVHTAGTLDVNGKAVSCLQFNTSGSTTRTLTLGAGSITCSAAGTAGFLATTTTNLTITANTGTITCTGASSNFDCSLSVNGASVVMSGTGISTISQTLTGVKDFTRTGAGSITEAIVLAGNVTCTGNFQVTGTNAGTARTWLRSSVVGTQRTVSAATNTGWTNSDVQDIAFTGAATWNLSAITGNSGDCGGNSGATFTTPTTQTWQGTSGGNWGDITKWTSHVPLPQDTAAIASAFSAAQSITCDCHRLCKDIDFTGATGAPTWAWGSAQPHIFGSIKLSASVIVTTAGSTLTLDGRGSHTLDTAGSTLLTVTQNGPGGTYTLAGSGLNMAASTYTVTGGTLALSSFTATMLTFVMQNALGTIDLGTGVMSLQSTSGVAVWNVTAGTVTAGTGTIDIATSATAARTFAGAGKTYPRLRYNVAGSVGLLIITGANTFSSFDFAGGRRVQLPASTTTTVTGGGLITGQRFGYWRATSGPGAAYVTLGNPTQAQIVGSIDLRCRVALDDWTPGGSQVLIGKRSSGGSDYGYELRVNTTGTLIFGWGTSAVAQSSVNSTAAVGTVGITDGTTAWVRATRDTATGDVKFYYAAGSIENPVAANFTQLGTTVASAASAIYNSAQDLEVAGYGLGSTMAIGNFYRAQVRNGIDTNLVVDVDFVTKPLLADSWPESASGIIATLIGVGAIPGDGRLEFESSSTGTAATLALSPGATIALASLYDVNATPANAVYALDSARSAAYLSGSALRLGSIAVNGINANYVSAPDSGPLSIQGDITLMLRAEIDDYTPAAARYLLAKNSAGISYYMYLDTTGKFGFVGSADGAAASVLSLSSATLASVGVVDGAAVWMLVSWRKSDGRTQFFTAPGALTNPAAGDFTQLGIDVTSGAGVTLQNNASILEIGSGATGTLIATGNYFRAKVYDGVFSTAAYGGTLQFDADLTIPTFGARSLVEQSANAATVTVNTTNNTGWVFSPPDELADGIGITGRHRGALATSGAARRAGSW